MRNTAPALLLACYFGATVALAEHWPHWRGPDRNGVSSETGLPVSWSAECADTPTGPDERRGPSADEEANAAAQPPRGRGRGGRGGREGRPLVPVKCDNIVTKNVAWKLSLPAYSGSTPIIWGDRIFLNVATAANTGVIELWAVDKVKQSVLWKRQIVDSNHMERKQNMSSPSPVTDGRHVWVMTGLGILKAFDFDGREIWARDIQADYGRFGLNWGYASSPLLQGDALYVQVLHGMKTDDPSYVLKIDKMTGKTVWRVERPTPAVHESPDSYTTPAWVEANGRAELIITGGDVVSGHDPATGKEYWRADVLNPQRGGAYRIIASPTVVDSLIIAPTRNNPLVAMRPGGSGDVAATHVAWTFAQGPDVPTPVSDGKLLYVVRDGGVVFALDVKTGATVYGPVRLPPGTYSASPILADGKIYVTTEEEGLTTVFKAGPHFEILSSNRLLDDCSPYCLSTVAISEGQLFMRTSSFLWAIGDRAARQ
ncbi:MAG TPA: PQQ-binding-like beta-propeller repeat protein [Vicinamibacterales bacterium]|nr:PQQ-binding-like beta-propeller repeat protein [Vicinamibacterales bacterium]